MNFCCKKMVVDTNCEDKVALLLRGVSLSSGSEIMRKRVS